MTENSKNLIAFHKVNTYTFSDGKTTQHECKIINNTLKKHTQKQFNFSKFRSQ